MFRLLSLCTKTAYIEIVLIKPIFDIENRVIDVFVSFEIPDYLRTSATGVRTSEKFRPFAPQDE